MPDTILIASITARDGRLLIKPAGGNFEHIYRAGTGVRLDADGLSLASPGGLDLAQQFVRISRAAAEEYGVKLQIRAETEWSGVDKGSKDALRNAAGKAGL